MTNLKAARTRRAGRALLGHDPLSARWRHFGCCGPFRLRVLLPARCNVQVQVASGQGPLSRWFRTRLDLRSSTLMKFSAVQVAWHRFWLLSSKRTRLLQPTACKCHCVVACCHWNGRWPNRLKSKLRNAVHLVWSILHHTSCPDSTSSHIPHWILRLWASECSALQLNPMTLHRKPEKVMPLGCEMFWLCLTGRFWWLGCSTGTVLYSAQDGGVQDENLHSALFFRSKAWL